MRISSDTVGSAQLSNANRSQDSVRSGLVSHDSLLSGLGGDARLREPPAGKKLFLPKRDASRRPSANMI